MFLFFNQAIELTLNLENDLPGHRHSRNQIVKMKKLNPEYDQHLSI